MDFVALLVLFLIAWLAETIMKSRRRAAEEAEAETYRAEPEGFEASSAELRDLVAEELGINMERRPRVQVPSEPAGPEAVERAAYYPRERRAREREARERELPPSEGESAEYVPPVEAVSLEEIGMRERGEAVSLETPRAPDAHRRFHERYRVPSPVSSHDEFHTRYIRPTRPGRATGQRASGAALPDFSGWGPLRRAIVWSEILGRPKGLDL